MMKTLAQNWHITGKYTGKSMYKFLFLFNVTSNTSKRLTLIEERSIYIVYIKGNVVTGNNSHLVSFLKVIWGVFASLLVFLTISNSYVIYAPVLPMFAKITDVCKCRATILT